MFLCYELFGNHLPFNLSLTTLVITYLYTTILIRYSHSLNPCNACLMALYLVFDLNLWGAKGGYAFWGRLP